MMTPKEQVITLLSSSTADLVPEGVNEIDWYADTIDVIYKRELLQAFEDECDTCHGNGYYPAYDSSSKYEEPRPEQCFEEIHDYVKALREKYKL